MPVDAIQHRTKVGRYFSNPIYVRKGLDSNKDAHLQMRNPQRLIFMTVFLQCLLASGFTLASSEVSPPREIKT